MALDLRGMQRREWKQFLRRKCLIAAVDTPEFAGHAGLLRILEVSEPFVRRVTLADSNYTWLQLAPEEGRWWLTVMYDPAGRLLQYYFDITARNFVADSGEPMFEDLFLDIVMQPDGDLILLDRDELDLALERGMITPALHAEALRAADELLAQLRGYEPKWRALCAREKLRLEQMMAESDA